MCVVEPSGVLEAIAEHSIEANVCRPDQGEWEELRQASKNGYRDQYPGREQCVDNVVSGCANSRIDETAQHEEIGSEE